VAGTCRLECEASPCFHEFVDPSDHDLPGGNGIDLGLEWRQAARDFVSVQEFKQA
jgi:hypothetical protein